MIILKRLFKFLALSFSLFLIIGQLSAQGLNIPSRNWGISFGNSIKFTGLRLNIIEKNIEQINGINLSVYQAGNGELHTGTVNGISIGVPMIGGTANRNGINLGIVGISASKNANGINFGAIGVGAGNNLSGLNIGGLGAGAGGNVSGITLCGLGGGAGGDVTGFTFGGLGFGAGGNLTGFTFGGLGAGAGGNVKGIIIGLIGVGAGENLSGLSVGGLGLGAGETVQGIALAAAGIAAPAIKGISAALFVGSADAKGIQVAPVYLRIQGKESASMTGISVSAFNHIKGSQRGLTIGIFNYAIECKGVQIGLLNHIASNPRGLRWLPIINASFK
jgi:hypothetical protein